MMSEIASPRYTCVRTCTHACMYTANSIKVVPEAQNLQPQNSNHQALKACWACLLFDYYAYMLPQLFCFAKFKVSYTYVIII